MSQGSKWRCQYVNTFGEQCGMTALHRLHFAVDHPFDHVDVCPHHKEHYHFYLWIQSLSDWNEVT